MNDKLLLIYPRFMKSHLLNYEFMASFMPGKCGVMPPTGPMLIAAMFEKAGWQVKIHDENVEPVPPELYDWADVVGLSGMHQQRSKIVEHIDVANARGKITMVGGSSVNICPEYYSRADAVHIGEIGDATARLMEWLRTAKKPEQQVRFEVSERMSLDDHPLPAFHLVDVNRYLMAPVLLSIGCPFTCEFCDIPMIYGRIARVKSTARVLQELDALYQYGFIGAVMFVVDNLIAEKKALRAFLPELIAWQKARDYPFAFTAEASLNLARDPQLLEMLRQARLTHMLVGVETPEPEALIKISKKQNVMDPVLESMHKIEEAGIEVVMAVIFGFDTDTPQTGETMKKFIDEAGAPIIHFNMLAALPKTPLWDRMEKEGRLTDHDEKLDELLGCLNTNVQTKLPLHLTKQMLVDTMRDAYSPEKVFARYEWNLEHVYGKFIFGRPPSKTWAHLKYMAPFALGMMWNVIKLGFTADYKKYYWRYLWKALKLRLRGKIPSILDVMFRVLPTAHHLILWERAYLANMQIPAPSASALPQKLAV
jgi:radical SAM superfamily enzyme YgiQ (UPF0313 family)